MAEALLKKFIFETGNSECAVFSAGLGALVGHKPDANACQVMLKKGIDISNHTACQLNSEMAHKADLILAMELEHKLFIENKFPSTKGKVFRLGEWGAFDIPDPYKKNLDEFNSVFNLIKTGVSQWIELI